jgi:MFS family permease
VLACSRHSQPRSIAPAERWFGAIRSGLRYTRYSRELVAAFARTAATLSAGVCLTALLPAFARGTLGLGSLGFGIFLGCMGAGAIVTALLLPRIDGKVSAETTLSAGTVVLGVALLAVAWAPSALVAAPEMFVVGLGWMTVVSSLNVAVQVATPAWVRARVSSVFMLVFQGAFVIGAITWGAIASRTSVRVALASGAIATLASVAARLRFPLLSNAPDFSVAAWPKPQLVCDPPVEAGPVLVTVTYRVAPNNVTAFITALRDLSRIRRREGAYDWLLYRDPSEPDRYVEAYSVASWAEHLRQHARVTRDERSAEQHVISLALDAAEPEVRHLVAVDDVEPETS